MTGGRAARCVRASARLRGRRRAADPRRPCRAGGLAALLTRRDRKYIVPLRRRRARERIGDGARILEIAGRRRFRYESVYFDTPDRASYLGAARRRRRYKVRTRSYLDAGRCLLEIKTRDARGRTVKERREHAIELRDRLDAGRLFLRSCPLAGGALGLEPVLTTRYTRTTLVVGRAAPG